MGIREIWVIDPKAGPFPGYEDGQLPRQDRFQVTQPAIDFPVSEIAKLVEPNLRVYAHNAAPERQLMLQPLNLPPGKPFHTFSQLLCYPADNPSMATLPYGNPGGLAGMIKDKEIAMAMPHEASASVKTRWMLGDMVGRSPAMERLFLQMRYLANHLRVALIEGESGTGKLLTAKTLHALATGKASGFVPCSASSFLRGNCNSTLEEARGGTLYLTRVDALAPEEQSKLLNLLEWHQHQHTRNNAAQAPRQILVSCEHPLRGLVLQGQMRADLSYHLTSVRLQLPPLRERRDDVPLLIEYFLEQFSRRHGKPLRGLGPGVMHHLLAHSWPGNVRELETTISSGALMCEGQWVRMIDLPLLSAAPQQEEPLLFLASSNGSLSASAVPNAADSADPNLDRAILRHIRRVLASVGGNKLRAARLLGISRSTLYRLLDADSLGIAQ